MNLCYLPKVWAPYFLAKTSPYEAWQVAQTLLAQLPAADQDEFDYLESWLKIACTGTKKSQLSAAWQNPYIVRDQRQWMQERHTANLNAVPSMMPPPAQTTGRLPIDANKIFLKTLETVWTLKPPTDNKQYTPLERRRLRACCNLSVMQYKTDGLPIFHSLLLAEGRSAKGTASALAVALKANPSRGNPGLIYVSPDLIKDVKECNYGYGGDKSYGNCHRGISPFAVPHTSLKLQQERRAYQERLALASNVTITDIAHGEASPVMVPQTYGELIRLLSNYIRLVSAISDKESSHQLELVEIQTILRSQPDTIAELTQRQNAYILWAIFKDARWFYSQSVAPGDPLTISTLRYVTSFLSSDRLPLDQIDLPTELLGRRPAPVSDASSRTQDKRPDDLFPGAKPAFVPMTNDSVPDNISAITGPFMEKFPDATVGDLLWAGAKFEDLRMRKRGNCMNYNLLGICTDPSCRYQHNKANPAADKAKLIAGKLKPVVDDMLSTGKKRKRTWHLGRPELMQAIASLGKIKEPLLFPSAAPTPKSGPSCCNSPAAVHRFPSLAEQRKQQPNVWVPSKISKARRKDAHPTMKAWGETISLMQPQPRINDHPFYSTLQEWSQVGCPIDWGPDWDWKTIEAALERGPHISALDPENRTTVKDDIAYQVEAGVKLYFLCMK
jgi:hypothetical protein